jgi:hypothetical protein
MFGVFRRYFHDRNLGSYPYPHPHPHPHPYPLPHPHEHDRSVTHGILRLDHPQLYHPDYHPPPLDHQRVLHQPVVRFSSSHRR